MSASDSSTGTDTTSTARSTTPSPVPTASRPVSATLSAKLEGRDGAAAGTRACSGPNEVQSERGLLGGAGVAVVGGGSPVGGRVVCRSTAATALGTGLPSAAAALRAMRPRSAASSHTPCLWQTSTSTARPHALEVGLANGARGVRAVLVVRGDLRIEHGQQSQAQRRVHENPAAPFARQHLAPVHDFGLQRVVRVSGAAAAGEHPTIVDRPGSAKQRPRSVA